MLQICPEARPLQRVPPGDPDALARALENVLHDARRAAEMGRLGRARIEREASWDMVAATVEKTYLEITRA